jgi:hypothetical protein
LTVIALAVGCAQHPLDYSAKLPPGELALRKISPDQYPSFAVDGAQLAKIHMAIQHSLDYLAKPSSQHFYPYGDISPVAFMRYPGPLWLRWMAFC